MALENVYRRSTYVAGVGMTKFLKPKSHNKQYYDFGKEAAELALKDANASYREVDAVVASYCYGEPTCGQRVAYELGLTGIPVFNTNNNCSSASSALMLARTLVQAGKNCVLAIGFEQMDHGLSMKHDDKASPWEHHFAQLNTTEVDSGPLVPGMNKITSDVIKIFALAAREYCKKYPNVNDLIWAQIAEKNRIHGQANEKASFYQRNIPTLNDIVSKRMLCFPITTGMSSATADGAAAALVVSENFLRKFGSHGDPIEIVSQHMVTDLPSSFDQSYLDLSGYTMSKIAAKKCLAEANINIDDVDVFEVHDCFSCNELFMYEALGLCTEGTGAELFSQGKWKANKSGNKMFLLGKDRWLVNPSGGLESKGHPIGATGLGQCHELIQQLRGEAGERQFPGPKPRIGMQQNFGLGSAAVVTLYVRRNLPLSENRIRGKAMYYRIIESKL